MKKQQSQKSMTKFTLSHTKINQPPAKLNIASPATRQTIIQQLYSRNRTPTSHPTLTTQLPSHTNPPYQHHFYSPRATHSIPEHRLYENAGSNVREIKLKKEIQKRENWNKNSQSKNSTPQNRSFKSKQNLLIQVNEQNQSNKGSYDYLPQSKTNRTPIRGFQVGMNSPKFYQIYEKQNYYDLKQKITDLQYKLKVIRKDYSLKASRNKDKEGSTKDKKIAGDLQRISQKTMNEMQGKKKSISKDKRQQNKQNQPKMNGNTIIIKSKSQNQLFIPKQPSQKLNKSNIKQNKNDNLPNSLQNNNKQTANSMSSYRVKVKDQINQNNRQNQPPNIQSLHPETQKLKIKKQPSKFQIQQAQIQLQQYISTYKQQSPIPNNNIKLTQCTSQSILFKSRNKELQANKNSAKEQNKDGYYISCILNAFDESYSKNKTLSSFDHLCRNHLTNSIQILRYIKSAKILQRILGNSPKTLSSSSVLPAARKPQTIVLDLDETLIHCNQNIRMPHDISIPIKFPNSTIKAGINIRPYAQQFLKQLSNFYQLIVFTASHQAYANVIIDYLDPNHQYISHRFFRQSCLKTDEGFYMKDLRVIDRSLKSMLLVDNAAYSYALQPDNGVPIVPFYDNKADLQLKALLSYLKGFVGEKDMRVKNSKIMNISRYTSYTDPKILINQLYM